MVVKVDIGENKGLRALIDSGATKSMVQYKHLVDVCQSKGVHPSNLVGLGGNKVRILGSKACKINMFGTSFDMDCLIIDDDETEYDVIIGVDFLKKNRFIINMSQKKISVIKEDRSTMIVYLDDESGISNIMRERVPVYSAGDARMTKGQMSYIPVQFECFSIKSEKLMYFESDNVDFESVDGLMNEDGENFVMVNQVHDKSLIKKGQLLGHVCTVFIVNEEQGETHEESERWSSEEIAADVELGDNLTKEQEERVRKMLLGMSQALSKGDHDIGCADVVPHKIELTNETPIWQKARHFSPPINDEIEKQCSELMASDILEYSHSGFSSAVVPVRKTDGGLRMCVDYRQVNKVTKKEMYPMPNMTKCIYKSNKVKFFTKLDLVRGYYQVPIDKESRKYTAFSTLQHHYQFKRLSFGLKNSGMAFQRMMQQVLAPLLNQKIVIYIDDILIMSETFEEHLDIVSKVLNLLRMYRIKIKVQKCEMFKTEVTFLGHVINGEGIRKSPEYIEKVLEVQKPQTVKEMRKFLGLINFQRKFVKDCSLLTKSLTVWTVGSRGKRIIWSDEMEQAFKDLKEQVAEDVMLTYPDYSSEARKMELYVDASGSGCGACLMQPRDGEYKVIAYGSMTFSDTERRYNATDRELAALRWGINSFRCFLAGVPFILITDHKPLVYLNNMSSGNSRLMRTLAEMAEFDFEVRYRPGVDNEAADFLSRMHDRDEVMEQEINDPKYLPRELKKICDVPGGGDSMFESLLITMKEAKENDGYVGAIPDSHEEMRVKLVEELSKHGKEYNLNNGKQLRQKLKLMRRVGQQPISEILLAASKLFNLRILVYHGMKSPIVFTHKVETKFIVRLQCISMVHYNPLYERKKIMDVFEEKYVNVAVKEGEGLEVGVVKDQGIEVDAVEDQKDLNLDYLEPDIVNCGHTMFHTRVTVGEDEKKFCCLLDTGAQVSIVGKDVIDELLRDGSQLELQNSQSTLIGFGKSKETVIEYVTLRLTILGFKSKSMPFAIISDASIPCCFLLGANFIQTNSIEMNFHSSQMRFTGVFPGEQYVFNSAWVEDSIVCKPEVVSIVALNVTSIDESLGHLTDTYSSIESDNDEDHLVPKFMIPHDELRKMQRANHALKILKSKIDKQIPPTQWKSKAIEQFKWSVKRLMVNDGLLVYEHKDVKSVVVSFPFMVDIVAKTHLSLNHIGRHKLVKAIQPYFWHPGLDKICLEFCRSCQHCQLYKISKIDKPPPTLKIQSKFPFDLVCIDTLSFPKSRKGNIALVVCVDHYSKWVTVSPIKDKRAITVANALRQQLLPSMSKLPCRIISDNGTEYRGSEFENALKDFNIEHCYSSPGHPAGNGACERMNQTIIQMLKFEDDDWDTSVFKVVINYNNSVHSVTKMSPSQMILTKSHLTSPRFPVGEDVLESWREGNPNFCPFKINQKVLRKIPVVGNQLRDKLSMKFEGPFTVTKVQSNKISYEIREDENPNRLLKVNHRQIKPWYEAPSWIKRYTTHNDFEGGQNQEIEEFVQDNFSSSPDSSDSGAEVDSLNGTSGYAKCLTDVSSSSESLMSSSDDFTDTSSEGESISDGDEQVSGSDPETGEENVRTAMNNGEKGLLSHRNNVVRNNDGKIDMKSSVNKCTSCRRGETINKIKCYDVETQTTLRGDTGFKINKNPRKFAHNSIESLKVKEVQENRRKISVYEQRLSVCEEMVDEVILETRDMFKSKNMSDSENWLNVAANLSSITEFDVNSLDVDVGDSGLSLANIVHSIPVDSVLSLENVVHSTPIGTAVPIDKPEVTLTRIDKGSVYDFSGFNKAIKEIETGNPAETAEPTRRNIVMEQTKTLDHILNVLSRIRRVCKDNGSNRKTEGSMDYISPSEVFSESVNGSINVSNNNFDPLLSETSDAVGDLPNLTPIHTLRSRVILAPRDGVGPSKKRKLCFQ